MMKIFSILLFAFLGLTFSSRAQDEPVVTIHYLGHSCFIIDFGSCVSVLTDYGKPNAWLEYGWDSPIYSVGSFSPDIITWSHKHDDHYDPSRIDTTGIIIHSDKEEKYFRDLRISFFPTSENDIDKPDNRSFLFEYRGLKVLHMGDCQANIMCIDEQQNRQYLLEHIPRDLDILMFPIEGTEKYISEAIKFTELINARLVVPMHYWSNEYKECFLDACSGIEGLKIHRVKGSYFGYSKQTDINKKCILDIDPSEYSDQ